jgi:hypothetical protein
MISSMCQNLESVSKTLLRLLIHKPSKSNQIYLILSLRSEYWIPRKEAQGERPSGCLKFNRTITLKKKRLAKPSHIFNATSQTLGMRFFLGGKAVTFLVLGVRHTRV